MMITWVNFTIKEDAKFAIPLPWLGEKARNLGVVQYLKVDLNIFRVIGAKSIVDLFANILAVIFLELVQVATNVITQLTFAQ